MYALVCIVWLLYPFDLSIFHNYSTKPNGGEIKEINKVLLCDEMIVLLCTIKYDAKHLQANKNKKLQNKQIYKIAKHLQASKKRILQNK
jgi:hypothetical protein